LRHVGRLRHHRRDGFFSSFESTTTVLDRDGQPALVSHLKSSLVLVKPASRQLQANGRPVFVVGINNLSKQPVDFRVGQVEAMQNVAGSDFEMKVVTYEMLVQEEKNRQIASAILTGVAAAGNA
jgi:hypothetical protein